MNKLQKVQMTSLCALLEIREGGLSAGLRSFEIGDG